MRAFILILILSLSLPFTLSSGPTHPRLLDSVRALSVVSMRDFTANTVEYRNICTVSSINATLHLWLTAAHCVLDSGRSEDGTYWEVETKGLLIDGHNVFVVKADSKVDLAILFTPEYSLPALHLSGKAPWWEDPVRVIGHPFGYPDVTIVAGTVSNPSASVNQPDFADLYLFITAMIAPGNSGSPVVNQKGEIVSVLQIGWGRGFSPGGGVTFARLKAFAGTYFEK